MKLILTSLYAMMVFGMNLGKTPIDVKETEESKQ